MLATEQATDSPATTPTASRPATTVPATTVPATTVPATTTPASELTAQEQLKEETEEQIEHFLQNMSPAERVGQLFAIHIEGSAVTAESDIIELIHRYHVGTVILTPNHENLTNAKGVDTPQEIAILTNQLQALAYGYLLAADQALPPVAATRPLTATLSPTATQSVTQSILGIQPLPALDEQGEPIQNVQIPLLIGVEQVGDGYPATALRRNFTPLPSQLALGSTWNPELVRTVGAIVGRELSAVGVNLLLGPSLDVVDQPRTDPVGALGIHTFGGDPYWVSKMGSAYISGIHAGSNNGLAAIARHFPGQGSIDRLPEQEVATVQQSLAELQRIALPPFKAVTSDATPLSDPAASNGAVDGLMTSHMRFSAFQGTTSSRIPPISFTPELQIALEQVGIADWHENGGILMTNALGTPAIRRYYQTSQQESPYRVIALDAFAAGHDLIYLAQLSPSQDWASEKRHIKDVIQFFQERYQTDADFQAQIDVAARRVLRLKLNLYRNRNSQQSLTASPATSQPLATGTFATGPSPVAARLSLSPLEQLLVKRDELAIFAPESSHYQQAAATVSQVARESMTLLYPDLTSLSSSVPAPPQPSDQLLIFSDSRLFQECATCTAETMLGPEELKSIMTRLYGTEPGATGQIVPEQVQGRSFTELAALLAAQNRAELEAEAAPTLTTTVAITGNGPFRAITTTVDPTRANELVTVDATTVPLPVDSEAADNAEDLVEQPLSGTERLQQLIDESDWIIFAMLDVDPERNPSSDVVKQFLRQESEQLNDKHLIVLSLNAPYYLDATEISKLTAYLGLYSKTQPFLESAVRALFRSYSPTGAPAVSVPGTRFDNLAERLQPNPAEDLELSVRVNGELLEPSPENGAPVVDANSLLRLQVEQITDHNGHLVPDGTVVQFHLVYENPEMTLAVEPVFTRNGSAATEVLLTQPGRLAIAASAREASTAAARMLTVQDPSTANGGGDTAAQPATAAITSTQPTPVTAATGATPAASEGLTTLTADEPSGGTGGQADWRALLIAIFTIIITLSLLLILQIHLISRTILVKNMLWATIFGLATYIFFAVGVLPGSRSLATSFRQWSAAVVVFIGMLLPLLWLQLSTEKPEQGK